MKRTLVRKTKEKQLREFLSLVRPVRTEIPLIRMGGKGDGGYLLPDDLEGIEACYSPGVDQISDFERECAERGMNVYLADGSVESAAINHKKFHFTKKFIGNYSKENILSLEDWIASGTKNTGDLLLQMDIEGWEYETLLGISLERLRQFRILIIEFHRMEDIVLRPVYDLLITLFQKLSHHHQCVHIHPNNYHPKMKRAYGMRFPSLLEFTYLRRDRFQTAEYVDQMPHPLDVDCTENRSLSLPPEWYRR